MDRRLAEETSILMLRLSSKLNAQLAAIKGQCTEDEFVRYREGFGYVMGFMLTEIMNPIYAEHPDLKPDYLGGTYQVDQSIYE